jgi:hypothetical protein
VRCRRLATSLVAVALLAVTGCGAPRNVFGTRSEACFQAFPAARDAVHHKGQLVGAHRANPSRLGGFLPPGQFSSPDPVCLVAFQDDFKPGDVDLVRMPRPGHFAVVVVTTKGWKAVAAAVFDRLPARFGRL